MARTRNFAVFFFCLLVTGATAVALKRPRQHDSKALADIRGSCPADQIEWYGGGCGSIIFTVTDHTPAEADKLCQAQGRHLPSVHSIKESLWILGTIKKHEWSSVIIGLVPGKCQWFDGTNFDFDYMASGEKCNEDGIRSIAINGDGDGHWTGVDEEYVLDSWICTGKSTPPPTVTPTDHSTCGQTPVKPNLSTERIMGGQTAVPYSWPWQVVWCSPGWFGGCSLECGGSVIDNGWVITAAQCVYNDMNPRSYQVKAAVYKEDATTESGEQISDVKAIHLNPNYEPDTHEYDVVLIELATPLKYTDHVQPICLPTDDTAAVAKRNSAYVTGWGPTSEQGGNSIELHQVQVPFVDYPTCEKEYPGKIVEKTMVCAGVEGKDACLGDTGGPLVVQGNSGKWFQVGIVSWGKGCGVKGEAGIYSRVAANCDFISAATSGKVSCQPFA